MAKGTEKYDVNSEAWWDQYFEAEWDAHGGTTQTRKFMSHLLDSLESVEQEWLTGEQRTILDWGCAFGDGADEIAKRFPRANVNGVDLSSVAIAKARHEYPRCGFVSAKELQAGRQFDAVITSNCLEHFSEPWEIAKQIAELASSLLAILVPYAEKPLMKCHLSSFDEPAFPFHIGELSLLSIKVIDVPKSIWPGEKQLLAIYASADYLADRSALLARAEERDKWNSYYADLPLEETDPATAAFNSELVAAISELLPEGGRLLEAGCGGGSQSLALARDGHFAVSLLDFAAEPLNYAKRLFEKEMVEASFVQDDAFAIRKPEYDLVFNAGVLEHYTLAEQASFLKGMASRSKRYVLVLIPNRACYWYWLWRVLKTGEEGWPFGKEIPLINLSDAFAAAGLNYLGQAFLGSDWTAGFIRGIKGIDANTSETLLNIHNSGMIPDIHRGYLLAAIGSVREDDSLPTTMRWNRDDFPENRSAAEMISGLSDALASSIAADMRSRRAEDHESQARAETSKIAAQCDALTAQCDALTAQCDALTAQRDALTAQCDTTTQQMAEVHLALTTLQNSSSTLEVRLDNANTLIERIWHSKSWRVTAPFRFCTRLITRRLHPEDRQSVYETLRRVGRHLPLSGQSKARIKHFLNRRFPTQSPHDVVLSNPDRLGNAVHELPLMREAVPGASDYIIFGVIDWHFRIQRPQQLAKQIAAAGHRVFYISSQTIDSSSPGFQIEALNDSQNLFQVRLHVIGAPPIYYVPPSMEDIRQLRLGIGELLYATSCISAVSLVQHAFWLHIAEALPNSKLVYDCMDHHEGFGDVGAEILALERQLMKNADLLIVTSDWLNDLTSNYGTRKATIRNAGDFSHFSARPEKTYFDMEGRRVIGYFGAIAEWFETNLVRKVANAFPKCVVLLIGNDTASAGKQLKDCKNVVFIGEVNYEELPFYLYGFDVCMMPFKVIPLTLATNPVKVYEYLCSGKPVVSVNLPEMKQFGNLVRVADTHEDFVCAIADALTENFPGDNSLKRQAFAGEQTWSHRARSLIEAIETKIETPLISVIVVTYNNLALTKECLESLGTHTDYPAMEVIIVDNASTDGTPEFLKQWGTSGNDKKIILNPDNKGFSAGNNQGLAIASGEYLVLLNNDTYVTPGWLRTLCQHLMRDTSIGIVGPVTNNIGNEAKIQIEYSNMPDMVHAASRYTSRHHGAVFDLPTVAFFCVMFSRHVFESVGLLDERFGIGFFEDDDYCRRISNAGWRVVCAEDVFIHHHLSASFDKMKSKDRQTLFEKNKKLFEEKWGQWIPHTYRSME